jgi:hypothetical protein
VPRRSALPAAALVAGLLAALATGCSSAPPEVTFAAGAATVQAGPTQYCELDLSECAEPGTPVELAVPAGTPVRITVPDEVAEAPWHVVFSYRDDAGQQIDERSRLFAPDTGRDYTLELPTPAAQLIEAQVQQFGPAPEIDPDTLEIQFPIRASWVLRTRA